jgi:hypothetical protein
VKGQIVGKIARYVGFVVCLALAAAACSGDDNDETSEGDDGGSTSVDEAPAGLTLEAVSTRPEYVTGGDVLVAVAGAGDEAITLTVDGAPVEVQWTDDRGDGDATALVTDLAEGEHELVATAGDEEASLTVIDHPVAGPLFSGPHLPMPACSTETFGLGAPVDDDCSAAAPVVSWSYVTTAGDRTPLDDPSFIPDDAATIRGTGLPFVLREEKGTLNRSVYWITVLDPFPNPDDVAGWDSTAWNGRLVYEFGGGCGVTYSQGFKLLGETDLALLEEGYAHATSTLNTFQVTCNAVTSAETTMVVKEHFSEQYGAPALTIGSGGSGGAIQQYQIAQNYPGLLDAAAPMLPFPDAVSIATDVLDCGLLERAYREGAAEGWTNEQRLAVSGHLNAGTCTFWEQTFVPNVNPTTGCTLDLLSAASGAIDGLSGGVPPGLEDSLAYDAETNPDGLRCTLQDGNVNILGRDPETGFAERPWDNVGVQYGLEAFNDGSITFDQFAELNDAIGSFDIDGEWVDERAEATDVSIETAYETGLVNEGGGDLRRIPIISVNLWTDDQGDIHTRDRAFAARERVRLEDGTLPPNLMIWTRGLPDGETLVDSLTGSVSLGLEVVSVLDEWATAAAEEERADPGALSDAEIGEILERTRPQLAVDNCITVTGDREADVELYETAGPCTDPYPASGSPRTTAGAPLRNDILKCELQPVPDAVDAGVYDDELTDEQVARLEEIFPDGVCDWTTPGQARAELGAPWRAYGD